MNITKEIYNSIEKDCDEFNERTKGYHDVDMNDVIYSLVFSDDNTLMLLNDWDEGETNDPYWNKEANEHSTTTFMKEMIKKYK